MKKTLVIVLAAVLLLAALTGCGGSKKTWTGKHTVEIVIKDYGTITLEVDADTAPITASNFLNLAKKGFYNNLTIYRAIDGLPSMAATPTKTAPAHPGRRSPENSIPTVTTTLSRTCAGPWEWPAA